MRRTRPFVPRVGPSRWNATAHAFFAVLSFVRCDRGGLATYGALAIPILLTMGGAMLDISAVYGERARLQSVAEGAALMGARDMTLAGESTMATERSQAWAEAEISDWENGPEATVASTIVSLDRGRRGVRVQIDANRPSMFGRLLPPGGWQISVSAVAAPASTVPLCVMATDDRLGKAIHLRDTSYIRAPACAVHSNRDIMVEQRGQIEASLTTAVRALDGNINGASVPDSPTIPDPFTDVDLNPPNCTFTGEVEYTSGTHTLPAGVHCKKIRLSGTAILRLAEGEHWFVRGADLEAKDDARVEGNDVVLLFDRDSKFRFDHRAMIRLTGREDGSYAGFVLIATRGNDHDFVITSENVESLLGVIYIPSARLVIEGEADVARESAWTVIVANGVKLEGNPTLFVNANYRASDVPVPEGVGPRAANPRLIE
jgi:hypothetical protein